MPSAGTRSPAWSSTMSPTTTSATGSACSPSRRRTRQVSLAASSCSLLNADSLPYSDSVDTKVAKKMAMAMPADSYQSKWWNKKIRLTARATSSTLMMGSPKLLKN